MEQVMGNFVSHSKALRLKVLYKTNEVEEQIQTSGYYYSPEESWWELEITNINRDMDVIRNKRDFVLVESMGIIEYMSINTHYISFYYF